MIEQAFHDCLQVGRDGRPTLVALESWQWLSADLDWTRHGIPAPPAELRKEFYASFSWCCHWLGENPDRIREQGLSPTYRVGSSQGAETWTGERIRGLPDVARRWQIAASKRRPY
jgi:hypothetical protein